MGQHQVDVQAEAEAGEGERQGLTADAAAIEAGRLLFARPWRFVLSAPGLAALPPPAGVEVAFAGRSNVGKSSLLNALVGQHGLARTSNTPGRTRDLNFFTADDRLFVVDMPGYGYARAPLARSRSWGRLVFDYLRGRPNLRRVFLLIDGRHGLKANDRDILDLLDKAAVSYQVVLTKADKPRAAELAAIEAATAAALRRRPAAHPDLIVTSAEKGTGIERLRAEIAAIGSGEPAHRPLAAD